MLFDIRTEDKAAKTLERLTGVSAKHWKEEKDNYVNRFDFSDLDKDIENIIQKYNGYMPKLSEIEVVVTHITTSSKECKSIRENGIVDLKKAYENQDSELRQFLEQRGLEIQLDNCLLKYDGRYYDISIDKRCPLNHDSDEYWAWSVGHKFYFDFAVCGFKSLNNRDVYAGFVHRRPEILMDIDKLLGTHFENEWFENHKPYEVVFSIPESETIYRGEESDGEYERVLYYLYDAFICLILGPDTNEIVSKNGVEVKPSQILECNIFTKWK